MKSLPSWDTSALPPLMIRLSCQMPRPIFCIYWSGFFPNLEGIHPWLIWCSLFWQDMKLLKTLLLRSSSSELPEKLHLLGYCLQFISNKTLSHFYYREVIDSFHRHTERFVSLLLTFLQPLLHVLLRNNHRATDFISFFLNSASKIFMKAGIIMNFWEDSKIHGGQFASS